MASLFQLYFLADDLQNLIFSSDFWQNNHAFNFYLCHHMVISSLPLHVEPIAQSKSTLPHVSMPLFLNFFTGIKADELNGCLSCWATVA